ncbi:hypothetical protein [Shimazuella kribbensis]|uniref:hypothetical protein n=1 Tax=Shimazuella kribbensis TaxID=139808 RepID=UPI0012EB9B09|nr:hypothetical protein [Shimazuella kribbensis]
MGKWMAIIFGIVYTFVAVLGLFMDNIFGLIMVTLLIEVIHFVVAILASVVDFIGKKSISNQNAAV